MNSNCINNSHSVQSWQRKRDNNIFDYKEVKKSQDATRWFLKYVQGMHFSQVPPAVLADGLTSEDIKIRTWSESIAIQKQRTSR
jgi:hypothetical protein